MYHAKIELDGLLTAWTVCCVVKAFTGETLNPVDIAPFQRRKELPEKTPERRKYDQRKAFIALGRALGHKKAGEFIGD